MFCPNCGKAYKDGDNFCQFCGAKLSGAQRISSYIEHENSLVIDDNKKDLQNDDFDRVSTQTIEDEFEADDNSELFDTDEELVLYEVNKHWMSLFWPSFLTPVFLVYFWNVFLTTRGFFSFFVVIGMLIFIIYPVVRFKSDSMVITNKFAHIKIGARKSVEINVPIDKFDTLEVTQSEMGKILNYGNVVFYQDGQKFEYTYIDSPEYLKRLLSNPKKYL